MFEVIEAYDKRWDALAARMPEHDVHFLSGYARAQNHGIPSLGHWTFDYRHVIKPFVVRSIKGTERFDIASLYGYGGSLTAFPVDEMVCDREFVAWCRSMRIVSEFCVFHPLLAAHQERFAALQEAKARKRVVVVDLDRGPDHLLASFRPTRRHSIVKAMNAGCTATRVEPTPANVATLSDLYSVTMARKKAPPRWKLGASDFMLYFAHLPDNAFLFFGRFCDTVESAALVLKHGRTAYYHFAGSALRFPKVGVNDYLIFQIALWAKREGCELLHLGGGVSSRDDDPLLLYKAGFSERTEPVLTAFRVFDEPAYDALSLKTARRMGAAFGMTDYEPAYRREAA